MPTKSLANGLTPTQVRILKLLATDAEGMSRPYLEERLEMTLMIDVIGPVDPAKKGNYPDSLVGRGLVKVRAEAGEGNETVYVFVATAKGVKIGSGTKVLKRLSGDIVPSNILDPVVKEFRKVRAYCFEFYTDDDIGELKDSLPEEYWKVPLESLRRQIANRRKLGAFADPAERASKAALASIRAFGPGGLVEDGVIIGKALERLQEIAKGE